MSQEIRAITVKRKWAERMFLPYSDPLRKSFEVRNQAPSFRGWVVVTISVEKVAYGIVRLHEIYRAEKVSEIGNLSAEELAFGRFAWLLTNAQRCEPVPCVGKLGLWRWTAPLPALLETEVSR